MPWPLLGWCPVSGLWAPPLPVPGQAGLLAPVDLTVGDELVTQQVEVGGSGPWEVEGIPGSVVATLQPGKGSQGTNRSGAQGLDGVQWPCGGLALRLVHCGAALGGVRAPS